MKHSRFHSAIILILVCLGWISCSTSSQVADSKNNPASTSSVYPGWFVKGQSFVSDSNAYKSYSVALSGDSAGAARKAITGAKAELESGISRNLEKIRREALDELGRETGLATSGFIMTLRTAETITSDIAEVQNIEVSVNESYAGYRGFAEVGISRTALLEELDQAMSRYRTAWGKMKSSQAFAAFN